VTIPGTGGGLLDHTPDVDVTIREARRFQLPSSPGGLMTRPMRRTRRRMLRAAGFAMLRGAAYTAGSTAMTGVLVWLASR
jgi:hypothetical protein